MVSSGDELIDEVITAAEEVQMTALESHPHGVDQEENQVRSNMNTDHIYNYEGVSDIPEVDGDCITSLRMEMIPTSDTLDHRPLSPPPLDINDVCVSVNNLTLNAAVEEHMPAGGSDEEYEETVEERGEEEEEVGKEAVSSSSSSSSSIEDDDRKDSDGLSEPQELTDSSAAEGSTGMSINHCVYLSNSHRV